MKSLKLNSLSSEKLSEKESKEIKGGFEMSENCSCACAYADNGGSSSHSNFGANDGRGLDSNSTTRGLRRTMNEILHG